MNLYFEKSKKNLRCNLDDVIESIKRETSRVDEVWISETCKSLPALVLHINGENACVEYFEKNSDKIWTSLSNQHIDAVYIASGEEWIAPDNVTISINEAFNCVNNFCINFDKPNCIQWQNLI